jgi:hypothetical protein
LEQEHIESSIMNGVGSVLAKIESTTNKLLHTARELFDGMQINLAFNSIEVSVEWRKSSKRSADNIYSVLSRLHTLAKNRNKKIVLFFDEFQQLSQAVKDHSIEAAIRQAAQVSTHVVYIFSGSNRHLLQNMFFDKKRPLYQLCDLILLERIEKTAYLPYIQKAGRLQWQQLLAQNVIEKILELTECHPYYVNLLCSKLWLAQHPPLATDVVQCWKKCALEHKSQIENELFLLSINQRKLLLSLASNGPEKHPNSKQFLKKTNLSQTSLLQSLAVLIEKDYIYCDQEGSYRLRDPLILYLLATNISH